MNVKYRASIIFVMYNNFDEAGVTIDSIYEQDCAGADVEVILSDDGSKELDKEGLNAAAERLRSRYGEVKLNLLPQNLGTVGHLNRIFEIAEGKYFIFISPGDRFPDKGTAGRILNDFEKSGRPVIAGRRRDVGEHGAKTRPPKLTGPLLVHFPRLMLNYMIRRHNLLSSCSTAYSRELIKKYGVLDEDYRLLDDYPYLMSLLQKGVPFAFTNEVFMEHSVGGGVSTGASIHPIILKDLELMQEKLIADPQRLYAGTVKYLKREVEKRKKKTGVP